ncbi:hypothetical protein BDZ97DRAFT_2064113 [Flammula alnicola]|nr:hypothetical protein BDZ97DRAFT_2064113 [Flammula alnicola]
MPPPPLRKLKKRCRKPQRAPKDWEAHKVVDDAEATCHCLSMSPPRLHLPCMQERAGGGFVLFNTTTASSTPSHSRARWRWTLFAFQCRHCLSTFPALKSEMEVDSFLPFDAGTTSLPPSHSRASQRWIAFDARCQHHLTTSPPPSRPPLYVHEQTKGCRRGLLQLLRRCRHLLNATQ